MELAAYNVEVFDFAAFSVWGTQLDGTCRCPKGSACDQKPGKHPVTQHGFHDATRDQEKLTTMLSAASQPNYGLVPPAGCVALDLDGEGWRERIAELEAQHGPLPITWTTRTPNDGQHRVFRWPENVDRPRGQVLGFVARWGDGSGMGYIVGPGSRINGKTYVPMQGDDGWPVPIADLPEAWARMAAGPAPETEPTSIGTGYQLPEQVDEGGRYAAILSFVASRYSRGVTKDEIWAGVRDVLAPRFTVALTESELLARFERTWRDTAERLGPPAEHFSFRASRAEDQEPPSTTGIIDLASVSTAPAPPLLIERLDPEGHTILYGTGGVGKGALATSWIGQLVETDQVVLVLDYEDHPAEWARRLSGINPGALASGRVLYWAPVHDGPLHVLADRIRAQCDERSVSYVLIDSAVMAAGEDPLDPKSAIRYAAALQAIGRSALSLAHVTKVDDGRYPFGSIFWHNLARTTWSLVSQGEGRALLRNRKRNNGPLLGGYEITTTWTDGILREVWEKSWSASIADRVWELLEDGGHPLIQIVDELNQEDVEPVKADSVRRVMKRYPLRFKALSGGVYERAY